jgi:hypothetical protein
MLRIVGALPKTFVLFDPLVATQATANYFLCTHCQSNVRANPMSNSCPMANLFPKSPWNENGTSQDWDNRRSEP